MSPAGLRQTPEQEGGGRRSCAAEEGANPSLQFFLTGLPFFTTGAGRRGMEGPQPESSGTLTLACKPDEMSLCSSS